MSTIKHTSDGETKMVSKFKKRSNPKIKHLFSVITLALTFCMHHAYPGCMLTLIPLLSPLGMVRAATCSVGNENCHPWEATGEEIVYGLWDGAMIGGGGSRSTLTTEVDSTATDYNENIYIGGRMKWYDKIYPGLGGFGVASGTYSGFIVRFKNGVEQWARYVHGDHDNDWDAVFGVPWVGISKAAQPHTMGAYTNFVAFYFKRSKTHWLFFLDGADGTVLNLQRLVLGTETDSFLVQKNQFMLQNINPAASSETTIANYRIFVGWADSTTVAAKRFRLHSRSTTVEQIATDKAATPVTPYGVMTMTYQNNKVWFGGSREHTSGGYRPMIGRAASDTLVVEEAFYWQVAPGTGYDNMLLEKLYTSDNVANYMIIGIGRPSDSSYSENVMSDKIMLIIGVDDAAPTQWDSVGCSKWTTYIITLPENQYRRLDDVIGPINDDSGTPSIYIWMRDWLSNGLSDFSDSKQRVDALAPGWTDPAGTTWGGVRMIKVQNFHNTIECELDPVDGVTKIKDKVAAGGTGITAHGYTYETRNKGFDCPKYTLTWCNYTIVPANTTCHCDEWNSEPYASSTCYECHLPRQLGVFASSRTLPSFVSVVRTPNIDNSYYSPRGAPNIVLQKLVTSTDAAITFDPTAALSTARWIDVFAEFDETVTTNDPATKIIDLAKLVLSRVPGVGATPAIDHVKAIPYRIANESEPWTKTFVVDIYEPQHYPDAQTHYFMMYDKGGSQHYKDWPHPPYPDPPGGSHHSNWTQDQIKLEWVNSQTQLQVSVFEHNFYRKYEFKIAARNILNTALSDYVKYHIVCHPDNRGTIINVPSPGNFFYAIQKDSGYADALFPKWEFTAVHGGCWFRYYGLQVQDAFPSDTGQLKYPSKYNYATYCQWNYARCTQVRVKDRSYARQINFNLGFLPRDDGSWVYAPFKILIFETQTDYLYEASENYAYTEVQSLTYIHTILTPAGSWPISSYSLRDPSRNNAIHNNGWISLVNPTNPATMELRTITWRSGFTTMVTIRAHTLHNFYYDVYFKVRVCGEERLTLVKQPAEYLDVMFWENPTLDTYNPAYRYKTITQAEFATWFTLTPANDPCIINGYSLQSYYFNDISFKAVQHTPLEVNVNVTWHGTFGSYEMKFDKTIKGSWTEFYLMVQTRGLVKQVRKMTVVVCDKDCFIKTSTFNETLEYKIPKDAARLGMTKELTRQASEWNHMVQFKDCPYCASDIYYKIMRQEGETRYIDNIVTMVIDGTMHFNDNAEAGLIKLYIEAYMNPTRTDCGFIYPIRIPIMLKFCGTEEIKITTPDPLVYKYIWNEEANDVIHNATSVFQNTDVKGCPIALWELWPTRGQSLQEHGPTEWSQFITVDPKNGSISVNHNNNPVVDKGDISFTFYLTALTIGVSIGQKEVTIEIEYPKLNFAPTFVTYPQSGWKLQVFEDDQFIEYRDSSIYDMVIQGHNKPVYKHLLPVVTDVEQNNPKAVWSLMKPHDSRCNCVRVRFVSGESQPVWIEVDQRQIRASDAGKYFAVVWLRDDQYEESHQQNVYTFEFQIEYEHSVYASFERNTGRDIRPRRVDYSTGPSEEDIRAAWLKKEEVAFKTEVDGTVQIVPQLATERTARVAEKEDVSSVIAAFKARIKAQYQQVEVISTTTDEKGNLVETNTTVEVTNTTATQTASVASVSTSSSGSSSSQTPGASPTSSIPGISNVPTVITSAGTDKPAEKDKFVPTFRAAAPDPVTMRITKVSMDGNVHIKFSEPLHVPPFVESGLQQRKDAKNKLNSTETNQTAADAAEALAKEQEQISAEEQLKQALLATKAVKPVVANSTGGNGRRLERPEPEPIALDQLNVTRDVMDFQLRVVSDEDPNAFKYDIYIKDWDEDGIVLHVEFANPLLISHGVMLDQCHVRVIDPWMFVSKKWGQPMPGGATSMIDRFPRQAISGVNVDQVEFRARAAAQACGAIAGTAVISLSCFSTLPGALWSGFYVLQLACFLQLYDIYIPASGQLYLDQFTRLVEFDAFNPATHLRWFWPDFQVYRAVFGGGRVNSALHHSDELYSIFNDWYFFVCIPFIAVALALLLRGIQTLLICKGPKAKVKRALAEFRRQFFYGFGLRFMFLIYLKLLASCGRHLEMFIDQSLFQQNHELYIALLLLPVILGLPAHVWMLMDTLSKTDGRSDLDRRMGTLCRDLKIHGKSDNMLYWPFFLLRRAFFVGIPTFSSNGGLQVVSLLASTLCYHFWYESVQPHAGKRRTLLERANEACLFFIFLHIAVFTDWNDDQTGKYLYGYSLGFLLGLIVVLNVGFSVTTEIDRQQRQKYLKQKRKEHIAYVRDLKAKEQLRRVEAKRRDAARLLKAEQDRIAAEMRMPKLEKQTTVPMTYGKRVMIKPTGLATVMEEGSLLGDEINDSIYRELGCFGDIVEASRQEILEGFVRPQAINNKKTANRKGTTVLPGPQQISEMAVGYEKPEDKKMGLWKKKSIKKAQTVSSSVLNIIMPRKMNVNNIDLDVTDDLSKQQSFSSISASDRNELAANLRKTEEDDPEVPDVSIEEDAQSVQPAKKNKHLSRKLTKKEMDKDFNQLMKELVIDDTPVPKRDLMIFDKPMNELKDDSLGSVFIESVSSGGSNVLEEQAPQKPTKKMKKMQSTVDDLIAEEFNKYYIKDLQNNSKKQRMQRKQTILNVNTKKL